MNLKEHDDNIFTKEKSDIEKYLLRIIQRYFDIENNYSKASVESIIVESLTRFKRDILDKKGFLFSLNQKTGHIILTIKDFNGEPAFNKNNAFNKDFGNIEDTICEGNDERLYDSREPLEHIHDIGNIIGLKQSLEKLNIPSSFHIHKNKNVLDILSSSAINAKIDLVIVDWLIVRLNEYCNTIKFQKTSLDIEHKKEIEKLESYKSNILTELTNIKNFTQESITWLNKAYDYTNKKTESFKQSMLKKLKEGYVTEKETNNLTELFKKPLVLSTEGEIPITDGTIKINPVIDGLRIDASSSDGDSLKDIYDNGIRVGYDNWAWDDTQNSFVFQSNDAYSLFASINKFTKYTHRVTLSSTHVDDDMIGVVIAYDDITGNHLDLRCDTGGMINPSFTSATLYYNNTKISSPINLGPSIHNPGWQSGLGWSALSYGITILVKKDGNNIKIWALYNEQDIWNPVESSNGLKDITPSESPIIDFDISSYTEFSNGVHYGYCCESQQYSTYQNVWFTGSKPIEDSGSEEILIENIIGHTDIIETNNISKSMPITINQNSKVNLFFRYEKDGQMYQTPLPFIFKDEFGYTVIIQAHYTSDNKIEIETNLFNTLDVYFTEDNFYTDTDIIIPSVQAKDFIAALSIAENKNCQLCLIDSNAKNNFVNNLLVDNREYFTDGRYSKNNEEEIPNFIDSNGNILTYFNWDAEQPQYDWMSSYIKINQNRKWEAADVSDIVYYVIEYNIKRLTQYFDNPRIYYQILNTKEGL